MRPNYQNVPLLFQRWQTKALLNWTDAQIVATNQQIQKIASENDLMYTQAKRTHQAERDTYRREHPRMNKLPHRLSRAVVAPPDFRTMWATLLKRRDTELRRIERENFKQVQADAAAKAQKRAKFLKAMAKGQLQARIEREKRIRKVINDTAKAQGLKLVAKNTPERLEELLALILTMPEKELA